MDMCSFDRPLLILLCNLDVIIYDMGPLADVVAATPQSTGINAIYERERMRARQIKMGDVERRIA